MSHSTAEAPALPSTAFAGVGTRAWPIVLGAVAFGFLWLEIIHQLASEWPLNPQYGYGWTVPVLASFLLGHRWSPRPPPTPPRFTALTPYLTHPSAPLLLVRPPLSAALSLFAAPRRDVLGLSIAILLFSFFFNAAADPYVALLADITTPHERGILQGVSTAIQLASQVAFLALIAIVAIVALIFLGNQVSKILSTVGKSV